MSAVAAAWTAFVYSPMSLVWTILVVAALMGACAARDAIVWHLPKARAARAADRARTDRLARQHLAERIADDHAKGRCWARCPHCADARTVDFWSPLQVNAFAEERERARLADAQVVAPRTVAWDDRDYA